MSAQAAGRWVPCVNTNDIELEDVAKWEFEGKAYAIYRSPENEFFATDDICTHEHAHLSDGFMEDDCIECPRHAGRFSYKTGEALGAPVLIDLQTFPVRITDDGQLEIKID